MRGLGEGRVGRGRRAAAAIALFSLATSHEDYRCVTCHVESTKYERERQGSEKNGDDDGEQPKELRLYTFILRRVAHQDQSHTHHTRSIMPTPFYVTSPRPAAGAQDCPVGQEANEETTRNVIASNERQQMDTASSTSRSTTRGIDNNAAVGGNIHVASFAHVHRDEKEMPGAKLGTARQEVERGSMEQGSLLPLPPPPPPRSSSSSAPLLNWLRLLTTAQAKSKALQTRRMAQASPSLPGSTWTMALLSEVAMARPG